MYYYPVSKTELVVTFTIIYLSLLNYLKEVIMFLSLGLALEIVTELPEIRYTDGDGTPHYIPEGTLIDGDTLIALYYSQEWSIDIDTLNDTIYLVNCECCDVIELKYELFSRSTQIREIV